VNRKQLARICDAPVAAVDRWIEEGLPCHWHPEESDRRNGREAWFDIDEVFVWWQQQQVARAEIRSH
jgi:phage terminase Nu1 subunit (DNA packaging protein)